MISLGNVDRSNEVKIVLIRCKAHGKVDLNTLHAQSLKSFTNKCFSIVARHCLLSGNANFDCLKSMCANSSNNVVLTTFSQRWFFGHPNNICSATWRNIQLLILMCI